MLFTLIAIALMAITPLPLVGCGSDRDRARGYVENGNAILAGVQSRYGGTGDRVDKIFDEVSGSMDSGKNPDPAAFEKSVREIKKELKDEAKEAERSRAEFEKVDGLAGVGGYRKYAGLRVSVIELFLRGAETLEGYLDGAIEMVLSEEHDPALILGSADELSAEMEKLGVNAASLEESARKLKKEQRL